MTGRRRVPVVMRALALVALGAPVLMIARPSAAQPKESSSCPPIASDDWPSVVEAKKQCFQREQQRIGGETACRYFFPARGDKLAVLAVKGTMQRVLRCSGGAGQAGLIPPATLYLAREVDFASKGLETARFGFVADCTQFGGGDDYITHLPAGFERDPEALGNLQRELLNSEQAANYALCRSDALALDPAAFANEVAGITGVPAEAMTQLKPLAEKWAANVKAYAVTYERLVQGLLSAEPELRRVLLDVPVKAAAAWSAQTLAQDADWKASIAIIGAIRGAGDSKRAIAKAVEGCEPALRGRIAPRLAGKTSKERRASFGAGLTRNLVNAYVGCLASSGERFVAGAFADLLDGVLEPLLPGPRMAGYLAAAVEINTLAADRSRLPIDPRHFLPRYAGAYYSDFLSQFRNGTGGTWSSQGNARRRAEASASLRDPEAHEGVIKSVVARAGGVQVSFRTVTWQAPTIDCQPTNRVTGFTRVARGEYALEYDQDCKVVGSHTEAYTLPPVTIGKPFAAGLTPGQLARLYLGPDDQALPIEVWSGPDRKVLVNVLGFATK